MFKKIKYNSIHARLFRFFGNSFEMPDNLCRYLWIWIYIIITLPLTFWLNVLDFTKDSTKFGFPFTTITLKTLFGLVSVSLFFILMQDSELELPLNLFIFLAFLSPLAMITAIALLLGFIGLGIYILERCSKPSWLTFGKRDPDKVTWKDSVAAIKNKYCTRLEWVDEEDN